MLIVPQMNDILDFLDSPEIFNSVWHPPKCGKYFELDATDEVWARPLGIGAVIKELRPEIKSIQELMIRKISFNLERQCMSRREHPSFYQ